MSNKLELRRRFLRRRKQLENREFLSSEISRRILGWKVLEESVKIMSYFPVQGEADISRVNREIIGKKELYLPDVSDSSILPLRVFNFSELSPGRWGIPSPPKGNPAVEKEQLELILVPGIVFDRSGGRIGFGGGYYDRFLKGAPAVKAGVCFGIQVIEKIASDANDESVDFLITEDGIFPVKRTG